MMYRCEAKSDNKFTIRFQYQLSMRGTKFGQPPSASRHARNAPPAMTRCMRQKIELCFAYALLNI